MGSDWDGGQIFPVITTLLRVLNSAGEHLDERQHCFTLQIATEQSGFPPNGARQQPITFYLNTETRQELIKVETAWTKAVTAAVKAIKVLQSSSPSFVIPLKCHFANCPVHTYCKYFLTSTTSSNNHSNHDDSSTSNNNSSRKNNNLD